VVSLMHFLAAQHQQVVKSQYSLLDPSWLGALRPPTPPRLAALAFLHPSAQATVAATVNVALSVVPFSAATNSYQRSPRKAVLTPRPSRSGTIAGWGRSAPQHPPARCARVPLPVASSTSDDPTNNNGSQTVSFSFSLQNISLLSQISESPYAKFKNI
jgi:hypothetical protein